MANIGYFAHPTIDSFQLVGVNPTDFSVNPVQGVLEQEMATGHFRKVIHFSGVGLPDVQVVTRFTIQYERLNKTDDVSTLDFVDRAVSRPGLHTFTNWKYVTESWTASVGQVEFTLPRRIANFVLDLPLPTEDPGGINITPEIVLGVGAISLVVFEKTTAEFDTETPLTGEAFIDTDTALRIKVSAVDVQQDVVVYVKSVPLFNVFLTVEGPRQLIRAREGRVLVIQEV